MTSGTITIDQDKHHVEFVDAIFYTLPGQETHEKKRAQQSRYDSLNLYQDGIAVTPSGNSKNNMKKNNIGLQWILNTLKN